MHPEAQYNWKEKMLSYDENTMVGTIKDGNKTYVVTIQFKGKRHLVEKYRNLCEKARTEQMYEEIPSDTGDRHKKNKRNYNPMQSFTVSIERPRQCSVVT
ncbi:unnamed protein product [Didymodactylos carnosus]|uniref:Uncharacterized protein n=1 Tax=Didymodactylos carnosus TaxID=1234261 RepID=A0A8S2DIC0_9BILA|nr:unnamed protein product [Didymodactylos carnosus]CAF3703224.1 unnamed protein product [Didymodactylos carnosus]